MVFHTRPRSVWIESDHESFVRLNKQIPTDSWYIKRAAWSVLAPVISRAQTTTSTTTNPASYSNVFSHRFLLKIYPTTLKTISFIVSRPNLFLFPYPFLNWFIVCDRIINQTTRYTTLYIYTLDMNRLGQDSPAAQAAGAPGRGGGAANRLNC